MAHLMEQDVNIRRPKRADEILPSDPLAPIAAGATVKPVGKPKGVVVMRVGAARARPVVPVLMEEAAAGLGALRDTVGIGISVHGDAVGRALEQALVAHGPADNFYVDARVREPVVPVQPGEPLLVLRGVDGGDLGALGLGHGRARLPPHAHVDLPARRVQLVPPVVLEAPEVRVRVHAVVPDLEERRGEGRGRAPARLPLRRGLVPDPGV